MKYKKIIVVDQNDKQIGVENLMDAIEKGLIRRAARVYVFNESGQLLVQQRGAKVLKPLMLDQSAAGHVDEGETYEQAAYRELYEELGIQNIVLKQIESPFLTAGFYNSVYKVVIPDDLEIKYDSEEVHAVFWYDIDKLNKEMKESPEKFTQAFKEVWSLLQNKLTQ